MKKTLNFSCGCSFEVLKEFEDDRHPIIKIGTEDIKYNCKLTWDILCKGLTAGIFQLESGLGKHYTQELGPTNIEHMSALGAILRPGCLDARSKDGKNLTQHFCLRKNGKEEVELINPVVDNVLKDTYGIIIYQENFMKLAYEVADFDKKEVDKLRKASGKKDQQEMADIMKVFKEKAMKKGLLQEDQIDRLIDNIKATARYSFNKSHSMSYGKLGYKTAYLKAHFPLAFYTAKLKGARFKIDAESSIQDLINEAKLFNIEVKLPDLRDLRKYFFTDGKVIKYGLCDIKDIGISGFSKVKSALINANFNTSFLDFVMRYVLNNISDSTFIRIIQAGAVDFFKLSRSQMLAEFEVLNKLKKDTERELALKIYLENNPPDIISFLKLIARIKKEGGVCHQKKRALLLQSELMLLEKPLQPYYDNPIWVSYIEEELLKYSISCRKIDSCDISQVNVTCKEFLTGREGLLIFGVDITNIQEKIIKRGDNEGKKFASLKITDGTCSLDAIIWAEQYEEYKELLTKGNSVIIQGERNPKRKDNTLVIKRIWQAK